jgi:hypothetical protein
MTKQKPSAKAKSRPVYVRLPYWLFEDVLKISQQNHRTMSSEIIHRLEGCFRR